MNMQSVSKEVGEKTAVLYSRNQNSFHMETVKEFIEWSIPVAMTGVESDWRLIAIVNSELSGMKFIRDFEESVKNNSQLSQ